MNIKSFSKTDRVKGLFSSVGAFFALIFLFFSRPVVYLFEKMNWTMFFILFGLGGWIFAGIFKPEDTAGIFGLMVLFVVIFGILMTDDFDDFKVFCLSSFIGFGIIGYYHGGKIESILFVETDKVYMKDMRYNSGTISYIGGDEMTKTIHLSSEMIPHYNIFKDDTTRIKTMIETKADEHLVLKWLGKDYKFNVEQSLVVRDIVANKNIFTIK